HQRVVNKKVTIPQTGGIGTLVFTVVGLSAMVFAFIAMKKRQSEEA
ncbi:LPXTG cell wall anchor domain-containing protein, partial [Streptococcus suis]